MLCACVSGLACEKRRSLAGGWKAMVQASWHLSSGSTPFTVRSSAHAVRAGCVEIWTIFSMRLLCKAATVLLRLCNIQLDLQGWQNSVLHCLTAPCIEQDWLERRWQTQCEAAAWTLLDTPQVSSRQRSALAGRCHQPCKVACLK